MSSAEHVATGVETSSRAADMEIDSLDIATVTRWNGVRGFPRIIRLNSVKTVSIRNSL